MSIQRQGETGRLAVLAAVLIAFVAGVFFLVSQFSGTSASSGGPEMKLVLTEGGSCIGDVCNVDAGAPFKLAVNIVGFPAGGYFLAQSWVDWGIYDPDGSENGGDPGTCSDNLNNDIPDGVRDRNDPDCFTTGDLIYKQATIPFDEIVWPDCIDLTAVGVGDSTLSYSATGCLTGLFPPQPASDYIGTFLELDFNCSAGQTSSEVLLLPSGDVGARSSGALFTEFETLAQIVPKTNSLTVNCLVPTITPTPTATSPFTVTPTITATFTPNPGPQMSLNARGSHVGCPVLPNDTTPTPTITPTPTSTPTPLPKPIGCQAEYWPGQPELGTFSLTVDANVIPVLGYFGFQSQVQLGSGLVYNYDTRPSCEDEIVWPDAAAVSCERSESGDPWHSVRSKSAQPFNESDYVGPLVELDVYCTRVSNNDLFATLNTFDNPTELHGAAYVNEGNGLIPVEPSHSNPPDADVLEIDCVLTQPEMSLTAFGPGVECDSDEKPTKCTVPFDEENPSTFTIAVDANAIPDGYGGFQVQTFLAGLVYEERSCFDEVIWRPDNPDTFTCVALPPPTGSAAQNQRRLDARASATGLLPLDPSFYVGRLTEMHVSCQEKNQFAIGLTKYEATANLLEGGIANPDGSTFFKPNVEQVGSFRLTTMQAIGQRTLDEDGDTVKDENDIYQLLDLLRINCVAPEPEPTPTITPTVTNTSAVPPTATPTPCDGICPTPTPTHTPTVTDTPTNTPTPTVTDTPTITPTPAPADSVHDTVPPGGKVTTGFGAEPSDPVETSVTLPVGGKVSIIEKLIVQPDPPGFHLIGQQVNISAPAGTSQFPLIITFLLDESIVPDGVTAANLPLFKGGILVPNCTGPSGKASPDPCVSKRVMLTGPAEGDIQLTVHTSTASAWNFGEPTGPGPGKPDLGDVNGDTVIDPLDALWVLFESANVAEVPFPNVADVNDDGVINPLDASLILQFGAGMIDTFPGAPSGIFWSWLGR